MYAIVEIGGMQMKAEESKVLRVPKMNVEPGRSIELDQVLLLVDNENIQIGKPILKYAQIQVKVLSHGKDKKVMVFKKKRRKGYKVLKGHRQEYTEIQVEKIVSKVTKPAVSKSTAEKTDIKPKTETKKVSAKASSTAKKKSVKAAVPKSPAKKAAPKKASASTAKTASKKDAASVKKEG